MLFKVHPGPTRLSNLQSIYVSGYLLSMYYLSDFPSTFFIRPDPLQHPYAPHSIQGPNIPSALRHKLKSISPPF